MLCVHGNPDLVLSVAPIPGLRADPAGESWRSTSSGWATPSDRAAAYPGAADRRPRRRHVGTGHRPARWSWSAHDWGGPISLGWAQRHRDQLAGLILTNTGVAVPRAARTRRADPAGPQSGCCGSWSAYARRLSYGPPPRCPGRRCRPTVRRALRAPYGRRARTAGRRRFRRRHPAGADHPEPSRAGSRGGRADELATVPALLLWGPRDPVFTQDSLRDLQHRLPHADVHRYAGASHLVDGGRASSRPSDAWRWVAQRQQRPRGRAAGPAPAEIRARSRLWIAALRRPAGDASGWPSPSWAATGSASPRSPGWRDGSGRWRTDCAESACGPGTGSRCWCRRVST